MREEHLRTLGLGSEASESDIKKAYRKLSKKYHPDISTEPDATDKFIAVDKAYDFLINYKEVKPDYSTEESELERWRREAKKRAREKRKEEEKAQKKAIENGLSVFNYFAILILFFNCLLTLDYLLPRQEFDQEYIGVSKIFERHRGGRRSGGDRVYLFSDFQMILSKKKTVQIKGYEKIKIEVTPIFKKPMAAKVTVEGKTQRYDQSYNIFILFGLVIPLTIILSLLYFFRIKSLGSKLSYATTLTMLLLFQLFIFFKV